MTRFGYFLSCEEYGRPTSSARHGSPGRPVPRTRSPRLPGPPAVHRAGTRAYAEAGFDEVYIGHVGGEHEGFFEFYANAVLPRLRER
jgi:hypothetical protein